eukprot:Lithocolla_globosa_v1_NODE_9227_length_731_cov_4.494083.p1 type:complete len:116 gc:universal NODE_9227_length_731_cov_4.494083:474-127(-)
MGTAEGDRNSFNYNAHIRLSTIRYAMLPYLTVREGVKELDFSALARKHLYYQRATIETTVDKWVEETSQYDDTINSGEACYPMYSTKADYTKALKAEVTKLKTALAKINPEKDFE